MSTVSSSPASAPKAMSSRLLTMKFMQRAAAASPIPHTPNTSNEPSPKRRKKDSDSPSRPKVNIDEIADQRAVQAAIAEEEAKRQAALERQGAELGDTRWVLSFEDQKGAMEPPKLAIRVVQAGYANLDVTTPVNNHSDEEGSQWEDKPVMVGRRSFGRFNKVLEKQEDPSMGDSSSDSDSSENDKEDSEETKSDDDDDPTSELIKASRQEAAQRAKVERKAKKKAEKSHSLELARQRKKKDVKLNSLTSLSGRQENLNGRTCHRCGGPHLIKDCPKRGFEGGDRGFSKKARTSR